MSHHVRFFADRPTRLRNKSRAAQRIGKGVRIAHDSIDADKQRSELDANLEQTSGLEADELRFVLAEGWKR